jgi:hypothetical protein
MPMPHRGDAMQQQLDPVRNPASREALTESSCFNGERLLPRSGWRGSVWNWVLLGGLCLGGSGCQMFHWLHPHQMWKLNRQPAISRDDAYFSIPAEPIDESVETADFSFDTAHGKE